MRKISDFQRKHIERTKIENIKELVRLNFCEDDAWMRYGDTGQLMDFQRMCQQLSKEIQECLDEREKEREELQHPSPENIVAKAPNDSEYDVGDHLRLFMVNGSGKYVTVLGYHRLNPHLLVVKEDEKDDKPFTVSKSEWSISKE